MTTRTVYVPRLIESAEQAEALPAGTLARHSEGAGMDHAHKIAAMPGLAGSHWVSSMGVESNAAMVGWTALVPIEAEEERGGWGFCTPGCERILHSHYPRKRLVTPWEEA